MSNPPDNGSTYGIPPEFKRFGKWRRHTPRPVQGSESPSAEPDAVDVPPAVRRPWFKTRPLWWSTEWMTGAALAGAIGLTTAAPLAMGASSAAEALGWWALTGLSGVVGAVGTGFGLRILAHRSPGAQHQVLEEEIWFKHSRRVPGGTVVDAPGQDRWRFSTALRAIEEQVGDLPAEERAALLREARTVAVGASQLLREAPRLGQARMKVFTTARFGRLDLIPDDSLVPGASKAYRQLLDEAERQLRDLADALTDLPAAEQREPDADVARLHAIVSLAELDADPTTRGGDPAIVTAADRLRAEFAAQHIVEGLEG